MHSPDAIRDTVWIRFFRKASRGSAFSYGKSMVFKKLNEVKNMRIKQ